MAGLVHRNIQPQARSMRELARMVADGSLDLDPPYQRGDVWTTEQRVNLMRSVLLGVPIAAIVLNRRGGNIAWRENEGDPGECWYACIDGKQRLTTMVQWFDTALAIPSDWVDAEYVRLEFRHFRFVTSSHLTPTGERMIASRCLIPVAEAQLDTLAEEAEVYTLINSAGTAQTTADLKRAASISGVSL